MTNCSFFTELQTIIAEIKCDNIIVCGDFNAVLDNDLDIISGDKHPQNVVSALNHFQNTCGLNDSWRLFNPSEKDFSWSRKNDFIARRIDYFFTCDSIFNKLFECKCTLFPFPITDVYMRC